MTEELPTVGKVVRSPEEIHKILDLYYRATTEGDIQLNKARYFESTGKYPPSREAQPAVPRQPVTRTTDDYEEYGNETNGDAVE